MNSSQSTQKPLIPMVIIGVLFFIFGFVTWLNGSLIPFLKIVCELNEFEALFVASAFYISYFIMALPVSWVLGKIGYKNGMMAGLAVMALGALLFIPAAKTAYYFIFLTALFILGTGLTLLQTAANPYIVCIGPRDSAAMRISIMGLINKFAGVIVPLLFTAWILTGMDQFSQVALDQLDATQRAEKLSDLSGRLVIPYGVMCAVLIGLAVFVFKSPLAEPQLEASTDNTEKNDSMLNAIAKAFKFPALVLGVITLFLYVGVEVIAGDTIGLYGRKLGLTNFGSLTSYTMGFMVLGYCVGVVAIPKWLSQANALLMSGVLGAVFVFGVVHTSNVDTNVSQLLLGWLSIPAVPNSIFFLALMGFANALVWPAVWPLALNGLGKHTGTGSAFLIMGIAGGALLPLAYGKFAMVTDTQHAYSIMFPCYLFIIFYALKGHKIEKW